MTLEDKDIIQIDATIITGILILLTLSFVGQNETQSSREEMGFKIAEILKIGVTITIIIPFTVSALLVTYGILEQKQTRYFRWAIGAMRVGFGYIIIGIVGIAALQVILIM